MCEGLDWIKRVVVDRLTQFGQLRSLPFRAEAQFERPLHLAIGPIWVRQQAPSVTGVAEEAIDALRDPIENDRKYA